MFKIKTGELFLTTKYSTTSFSLNTTIGTHIMSTLNNLQYNTFGTYYKHKHHTIRISSKKDCSTILHLTYSKH